MPDAALSPPAALARRADPDRFLAALFAPPALRETLLLLAAFNHELARAAEVTREPMLALIRLQWWREVVEGTGKRHEIATPLSQALAAGRLRADELEGLIAAREADAAPEFDSLAAWLAHVRATAGAMARIAGRVLGADAAMAARLEQLGTAYGIAGQLRAAQGLARRGRCLLPREALARHGLAPEAVVAQPDAPALQDVAAELAGIGRGLLREHGGAVPRPLIAAALPAVLARLDLGRRLAAAGPRPLGDRVAVLAAYLRARV